MQHTLFFLWTAALATPAIQHSPPINSGYEYYLNTYILVYYSIRGTCTTAGRLRNVIRSDGAGGVFLLRFNGARRRPQHDRDDILESVKHQNRERSTLTAVIAFRLSGHVLST